MSSKAKQEVEGGLPCAAISEWVHVGEQLPDKGIWVLTIHAQSDPILSSCIVLWRESLSDESWYDGQGFDYLPLVDFTHWAYITPPTESNASTHESNGANPGPAPDSQTGESSTVPKKMTDWQASELAKRLKPHLNPVRGTVPKEGFTPLKSIGEVGEE